MSNRNIDYIYNMHTSFIAIIRQGLGNLSESVN